MLTTLAQDKFKVSRHSSGTKIILIQSSTPEFWTENKKFKHASGFGTAQEPGSRQLFWYYTNKINHANGSDTAQESGSWKLLWNNTDTQEEHLEVWARHKGTTESKQLWSPTAQATVQQQRHSASRQGPRLWIWHWRSTKNHVRYYDPTQPPYRFRTKQEYKVFHQQFGHRTSAQYCKTSAYSAKPHKTVQAKVSAQNKNIVSQLNK